MKKQIRILGLIGLVAIVVLVAGIMFFRARKVEVEIDTPIRIGAMLPLTGPVAFIGENFRMGLLLAYEESGFQERVNLAIEDHKNSPKDAVSIYRKFLMEENMPVIIPTFTSITGAIIPLIEADPRVVLTSIASGSDLPGRSEWLFRYFLSSPDEVEILVKHLHNSKIEEIGVFYINDEFGLDARKVFANQYKGKILFQEPYEKGARDFRDLVPLARTAEAIYIIGYGPAYGTFVRQLRTYGFEGKIFAFSGFTAPIVREMAEPYAEGIVFTGTIFSSPEKTEAIKDFTNRYEIRWGRMPDYYSAYGYDIGTMIFKALDELWGKGDNVNPESIRATILNWGEYRGLFGETVILLPDGDFKFEEVKLFTVDKDGNIVEVEE